jgi:glycosyltransferase involved in cell wall biosynthesis
MKIVIMHYHLKTGGVSRVIESQIIGLHHSQKDIQLVVLYGEESKMIDLHSSGEDVSSLLYYSDGHRNTKEYHDEVSGIMTFIKKSLSENAILHCHNPNLGKNPSLTLAVYKLAMEGYHVVNHCHDFPEDRPENLSLLEEVIPLLSESTLNDVMYPRYPAYHFIVLNSYDHDRILSHGIPSSQVHLLFNPVVIRKPDPGDGRSDIKKRICDGLGIHMDKKICTYPVRAIERKNLGEFILLSSLFADIAHFIVTQPPKNPKELPLYLHWKQFCKDHGIMLKFEAGEQVNYEELINISDFCITTSIREGFGMVYLEPWLAGTPVIGRDLPYITRDLKNQGVEFPRLYNSILIETSSGKFDFKDLEPMNQEEIIANIMSRQSYRLKVFHDNPWLFNFLDDFPSDIIQYNQNIIELKFSVEEYGQKLLAIYNQISR